MQVDGFLRFADFFFDNLFTDWAVLDHIGRAKNQVRETRRQLTGTLQALDSLQAADQAKLERDKAELDALILRADVE